MGWYSSRFSKGGKPQPKQEPDSPIVEGEPPTEKAPDPPQPKSRRKARRTSKDHLFPETE